MKRKKLKSLVMSLSLLALAVMLFVSAVFAWFMIMESPYVDDFSIIVKGQDFSVSMATTKNGEIEEGKLFSKIVLNDEFIITLTLKRETTTPIRLSIELQNIIGEDILYPNGQFTGYNMKDMFYVQNIFPENDETIDYRQYSFNQLDKQLISDYVWTTKEIIFKFYIIFTNRYTESINSNWMQRKNIGIGAIFIDGK